MFVAGPEHYFSRTSDEMSGIGRCRDHPAALRRDFNPVLRADDVATVLGDQRHAARIVKRDVPDFNTGRLVKRESRIAAVSRMGAFIRIDASHRRQLPRRVAAQTDKRIADPFGLQRFFLIVFVLFGLIVGRTGSGIEQNIFTERTRPVVARKPGFPAPDLETFRIERTERDAVRTRIVTNDEAFEDERCVAIDRESLENDLFASSDAERNDCAVKSQLGFFSSPFDPYTSHLLEQKSAAFIAVVVVRNAEIAAGRLFGIEVERPRSESDCDLTGWMLRKDLAYKRRIVLRSGIEVDGNRFRMRNASGNDQRGKNDEFSDRHSKHQ